MARLYLDDKGKPYGLKLCSEKRFEQVEIPILKDGKVIGSKTEDKEKTIVHEEKDYDIQAQGWKKQFVYRALTTIIGHKQKKNSTMLVPFSGLFVITFKVNADKMGCACGKPEIYVRDMPSGLFKTCASCGVSSGSMCTSESIYKSEGIEKIDEMEVSPQQAKTLFNEGFIHFADISLRQKLGLPDM